MQLKIDPCGISATNTITRVELVAIYAALQEVGPHDCTIAIDSLASMFSINRALWDDPCHNESPHAVLLTEIAKLILRWSQLNLRTALIKVKSHTGVQGNEMADQLANAARQPDHCHLSISLGNHAFNNQMWPQILKCSCNPQAGGRPAWHTANNLHSCLRTHVASKHAGLTTPGQYHSFWNVVRPELHPSSFSFWRSNGVPFRNKVNLLKARWGQLWNKNIARRQKMSYMPGQARATDAACLLCGEHDGITHMLGNCSHPMMKAMYIERHNAATRKVLRLILKGSRGSCYMLADVGSTDKLGNIGPLDSRLPEWLVPTNILQQRGLDRDKLRPDILMTSGTPATTWGFSSSSPSRTSAPGAGTHPMGKHIWIVEVGYCAATRYHNKMT